MRKAIGKALRDEFERALRARLPQFSRVVGATIYPGDRLFRWWLAPGLACFIRLVPDQKRDRFNVEVGWSDGAPPQRAVFFPDECRSINGSYCRIVRFRQDSGMEQWWSVSKDLPWLATAAEHEHGATSLEKLEALATPEALATYLSTPEEPVSEGLTRIQALVADAVTAIELHAVPFFLSLQPS